MGGVSGAVAKGEHDKYQVQATAAVDHLNSVSNSIPAYELGRVVEVKTQVVAGTMLFIKYETTRDGTTETSLCESKVWDKLDGTREVVESKCHFTVEAVTTPVLNQEQDTGMVGGFRPIDHHTAEVRSVAVEYIRTLDKHHQERLYVCSAKSQVVNGVNYEIEVSQDKACTSPDRVRVYKSFADEYEVKAVVKGGTTQ